MRISSPTNPLVRRLRRLADSPRECREQHRTLAEGLHVIETALDAGVAIQTLVLRAGTAAAARALAARVEARQPDAKQVELSAALYDAISPVEHGAGVLAEIAVPPRPASTTFSGDAVFLEGIQDPGNVGAMLRTAAASGVATILAGAGTAYLWAPKVVRAAMGAHFVLQLNDDVPLAEIARGFRGDILAAHVDGDDLYESEWGDGATMWIFGSEGRGLSAEALALARRRLSIPMAPGVESLNVAAAAAVCLFEQRRRRGP
jgi:RNA methyltransferase, TrmH family